MSTDQLSTLEVKPDAIRLGNLALWRQAHTGNADRKEDNEWVQEAFGGFDLISPDRAPTYAEMARSIEEKASEAPMYRAMMMRKLLSCATEQGLMEPQAPAVPSASPSRG